MNSETLKKVFEVIKTADGGCSVCVRRLLVELAGQVPGTREALIDLIKNDKALDWEDYEDEL